MVSTRALAFQGSIRILATRRWIKASVALIFLTAACSDEPIPSRMTGPLSAQRSVSDEAAQQTSPGEEVFANCPIGSRAARDSFMMTTGLSR